jgi:hypothetical protein
MQHRVVSNTGFVASQNKWQGNMSSVDNPAPSSSPVEYAQPYEPAGTLVGTRNMHQIDSNGDYETVDPSSPTVRTTDSSGVDRQHAVYYDGDYEAMDDRPSQHGVLQHISHPANYSTIADGAYEIPVARSLQHDAPTVVEGQHTTHSDDDYERPSAIAYSAMDQHKIYAGCDGEQGGAASETDPTYAGCNGDGQFPESDL